MHDHLCLSVPTQHLELIVFSAWSTSSQCSLLTHKSSVCNPAFVLQKEISHYYYYYFLFFSVFWLQTLLCGRQSVYLGFVFVLVCKIVILQNCHVPLNYVHVPNVIIHVFSARMEEQPASRQQLEVLSSVKEITGALVVKTNDTEIADLSFLRSLRVIHGRQLEWVLCTQNSIRVQGV